MPTPTEPLKPDDFPLHVEGDEIKSQDGKPVASTKNTAVAADLTERPTKTKTGEKKISGQPDYRRLAILADLAPNGSARARRRRL